MNGTRDDNRNARRIRGALEARDELATLEARFRREGDARAVFTGAYGVITEAMCAALHAGRFEDPAWVDRYLAEFADLYVSALHLADTSATRVPPAWRVAFSACRSAETSPLTHLLLGVNAHVNRDLSFALLGAGLGPDPGARYRDHARVNDILQEAVNDLQDSVTRDAPALARLDTALGPWDERLSCRVVAWARDVAWLNATRLAPLSGAALDLAGERVDRRAYRFARLISLNAGL